MAQEEEIEKTEDLEPEKTEKLDIEDIKDPDEKIEDLDLEEAVSEEAEPATEKEEPKEEKTKKEDDPKPTPSPEAVEAVIAKTSEVKKPRKPFPLKPVLIALLLIILTAALVLGGVYYYLNNKKKTDDAANNPPQTTDATSETAASEAPVSTDVYRYVSEPVGLNLRKEASTMGELVALMPFGAKLKVLNDQNDWLQVEYNSKTGWCAKQYTSTTNPLVYQNTDYGFELTFPQSWAGYKVFKKSITGTTATYYVGLPTTDTAWTDSGVDKGYASLFAVSVYTSAQWTTAAGGSGSIPSKLGEKGGYVFAWSSAQSSPSDLESKFSDNKTIVATFKTL